MTILFGSIAQFHVTDSFNKRDKYNGEDTVCKYLYSNASSVLFLLFSLDEHGATTDIMKLMMDVYNLAVKVILSRI